MAKPKTHPLIGVIDDGKEPAPVVPDTDEDDEPVIPSSRRYDFQIEPPAPPQPLSVTAQLRQIAGGVLRKLAARIERG